LERREYSYARRRLEKYACAKFEPSTDFNGNQMLLRGQNVGTITQASVDAPSVRWYSWAKTPSLLLMREEREMIVADANRDSNSLVRRQHLPVQEALDGSDTTQNNASIQHLDLHTNQFAASRALLDFNTFFMTKARLIS
jgi:hypothetical protein